MKVVKKSTNLSQEVCGKLFRCLESADSRHAHSPSLQFFEQKKQQNTETFAAPIRLFVRLFCLRSPNLRIQGLRPTDHKAPPRGAGRDCLCATFPLSTGRPCLVRVGCLWTLFCNTPSIFCDPFFVYFFCTSSRSRGPTAASPFLSHSAIPPLFCCPLSCVAFATFLFFSSLFLKK